MSKPVEEPDVDNLEGAMGNLSPTSLSEAEMIEILSAKYDIKPRGPPQSLDTLTLDIEKGARPKRPQHFQFTPASVSAGISESLSSPVFSHPATFSHVPKIPFFSGEVPVPKKELSYYEWRHEIRCLRRDPSITDSQMLQAIRSSLLGTPRKIVVSLGDSASIDDIFSKLDANFAEPSRKGVTMKEFFNTSQRHDETITAFGCRLESVLENVFEGGHLPRGAKNELMCERFWSGLNSDTLKSNTRHLLDSVHDYDHLLRDVRQVQKELQLDAPKQKAHQHQQSGGHDIFMNKLSELENRLENRITSIQSGVDKRFAQIMQKIDQFCGSTVPSEHTTQQPKYFSSAQQPPNFYHPQSNAQPHSQLGRRRQGNWRGRGGNVHPKV